MMMSILLRGSLLSVFAVALAALLTLGTQTVEAKGTLAASGYDPVSYFSGRQPVKGQAGITARHDGVTYQFASAENRDRFLANPGKFAPQYGGYCAFGVSRGYKVGVDPLAFKVVDGKLYLNYSRQVQRQWNRDVPGHIARADSNWPDLK